MTLTSAPRGGVPKLAVFALSALTAVTALRTRRPDTSSGHVVPGLAQQTGTTWILGQWATALTCQLDSGRTHARVEGSVTGG